MRQVRAATLRAGLAVVRIEAKGAGGVRDGDPDLAFGPFDLVTRGEEEGISPTREQHQSGFPPERLVRPFEVHNV